MAAASRMTNSTAANTVFFMVLFLLWEMLGSTAFEFKYAQHANPTTVFRAVSMGLHEAMAGRREGARKT